MVFSKKKQAFHLTYKKIHVSNFLTHLKNKEKTKKNS